MIISTRICRYSFIIYNFDKGLLQLLVMTMRVVEDLKSRASKYSCPASFYASLQIKQLIYNDYETFSTSFYYNANDIV